MGLCVKCRIKQAENKDGKCLDCSREYYKNFYQKRKELGICIKCHRKNLGSGLLCSICSQKAKIAQNDRRVNDKKDFLCVACGTATDGQHTECEKCRIQRNNIYIELADKASCEGLCCQCRENVPKEGLKICYKCSEKAHRYYIDKVKYKRQQQNKKLKLLVFNHYGHQCTCCGENNELLLNIDHMNNDGNIHRQKVGGGVPIYKEIVSLGFPDLYQLLCYNCNIGKYRNGGICPHKQNFVGV